MPQDTPTPGRPLREDLTLTLTIQITPQTGQSMDDARQEMAHMLRDYFTDSEFPLLADYSPDAWGGYDGPFIASIRLEAGEVILGEYRHTA